MPEPKLSHLYDATAPIACTISNAEIPERIELIERMRSALTGIDRTSTGLLLHFPDDPAVRADLAVFAADEKRCCQFWGFDILEQGTGVALRWEGPPAVDDFIAKLQAFFTSDEPVSMLDGLL